ncbi:hypothetical protein JY651_39705 [Pyxidicoccus parkwayensis]|uniref:Uncharacterized protein n=1 Tax=Pyxidicoccus parkwayensis TaxID=2813578 RepID=A0ABX7NRC7_9BACT|nr:hypothetical protein [Pyxidicoccus parkwaysis]QSQ21258.1 hypothetical protein JY651_39705 [Pyxidicoccus parkwaysis]
MTRSFAWHALLVIGGLVTLWTLLGHAPLRASALPLLVYWGLGVAVCGAVFLVSLFCPCRWRKAVRK